MSYTLYDVNDNIVSNKNLQNKGLWCEIGAGKEEVFVRKYGELLGLAIHPDKKYNPYGPDLINLKNGKPADLKTQNTPFFQAGKRFGMDPQFTVVFNHKDRIRYKEKYPNIEIYFAVDWQAITFKSEYKTITVNPMQGLWYINFQKLNEVLEKAPLHNYQQRVNDKKGNAKGSYIVSLADQKFKKLI